MATTFEWDTVPKTLRTCSGLQDFSWKTTGETVEVDIVITNAGIDQTDPDLDGDNDASEFTSWLNYVLTSLIALLVALKVRGQTSLNGWVLYTYVLFRHGYLSVKTP